MYVYSSGGKKVLQLVVTLKHSFFEKDFTENCLPGLYMMLHWQEISQQNTYYGLRAAIYGWRDENEM